MSSVESTQNHGSEKAGVGGSTPSLATTSLQHLAFHSQSVTSAGHFIDRDPSIFAHVCSCWRESHYFKTKVSVQVKVILAGPRRLNRRFRMLPMHPGIGEVRFRLGLIPQKPGHPGGCNSSNTVNRYSSRRALHVRRRVQISLCELCRPPSPILTTGYCD